jgi:hypothetical protein
MILERITMARRQIVECDLCKGEVEDDASLLKVTIKKPKAKSGNAFEICPYCAEKVQTQLVSNSAKRLNANWIFGDPTFLEYTMDGTTEASESDPELLEEDEQVRYVRGRERARKRRRERSEADYRGDEAVDDEVGGAPPRKDDEDTILSDRPSRIDKVAMTAGDEDCPHYNKTAPKWGRIDGKDGEVVETMYQKCNQCNATLRYRTKEQQAKFLSGRTGEADISLTDHESETRKRT